MKFMLSLGPVQLKACPHSRRWALTRSYHENIIDHYENPRNVGSLDKRKKTVGTGLVGAPACGDVMKLQFETDEKGVIIDGEHSSRMSNYLSVIYFTRVSPHFDSKVQNIWLWKCNRVFFSCYRVAEGKDVGRMHDHQGDGLK